MVKIWFVRFSMLDFLYVVKFELVVYVRVVCDILESVAQRDMCMDSVSTMSVWHRW